VPAGLGARTPESPLIGRGRSTLYRFYLTPYAQILPGVPSGLEGGYDRGTKGQQLLFLEQSTN
jgi:hypothetical protein